MKIIISPAKKMNTDLDSLPPETLPRFLPETAELLGVLQKMDYLDLKTLWGCNDTIARFHFQRLQSMDLQRNLTPAILSYEGIQYQYMAPGVFETSQLAYINRHLCILSGFYGLLRPFDGVTPYRLEMRARLPASGYKDLYQFWGYKLAQALSNETDFVLNLASREYSKAVTDYLSKQLRVLTCCFGEMMDGKVIEKGTLCKMARGEMVRYLAECHITDPEHIKAFNRLGYAYSWKQSSEDRFVFLKV